MAERAEINLQWKGTDACYDFYCPCGWEGPDPADDPEAKGNHEDGMFKQWFQCGGCLKWWWLPNAIKATEVSDEGVWPDV